MKFREVKVVYVGGVWIMCLGNICKFMYLKLEYLCICLNYCFVIVVFCYLLIIIILKIYVLKFFKFDMSGLGY